MWVGIAAVGGNVLLSAPPEPGCDSRCCCFRKALGSLKVGLGPSSEHYMSHIGCSLVNVIMKRLSYLLSHGSFVSIYNYFPCSWQFDFLNYYYIRNENVLQWVRV